MIAASTEAPGVPRSAATHAAPVVIRGTEGMALVMASCCTPIPGDEIVGHMRRDQGLAVHQSDCANASRARRADPERWLDMQWAEETTGTFSLNLDVHAINERGVLGRVAAALAEAGSNIQNVHIDDDGSEIAVIHFKVQARDRQHLAHVIRTLRRVKQVSKVLRVRLRERGSEDS
jgi:GTP pyrophosphokinase